MNIGVEGGDMYSDAVLSKLHIADNYVLFV
jgi:hypothetical protein